VADFPHPSEVRKTVMSRPLAPRERWFMTPYYHYRKRVDSVSLQDTSKQTDITERASCCTLSDFAIDAGSERQRPRARLSFMCDLRRRTARRPNGRNRSHDQQHRTPFKNRRLGTEPPCTAAVGAEAQSRTGRNWKSFDTLLGMADAKKKRPLSSDADFDGALSTVKELVGLGLLRWQISGAGSLSARVEDGRDVTLRAGEPGSEARARFDDILTAEIVPLFNAIAGAPTLLTWTEGVSGADVNEVRRARSAKVKDAIFEPSIRDRVVVRQTSKGPVLEEVHWDISIKKHDLLTGSVSDVPYATIELIYRDAAMDVRNPLTAFGIGAPPKSIAFDCHLRDLEALMADLKSLHENLSKVSAEISAK
jgi:hypothetical protein